jgi:hypothetical protein
MVGFSPTAGHQSSYRLACGRPRLVLRRQSFLRLASPLPCLCLIYPRCHVLPPSLSHTHSPTSSSTSSTNSDSFRCSLRDTCDTHHIHSLNFKIPLDNRSLPPKNTLRDTLCLTAADTVAVAVATPVAAAAAVEDTAAGTTPQRIADMARRTTIPMGMPYGLCALIAPFRSYILTFSHEQTC